MLFEWHPISVNDELFCKIFQFHLHRHYNMIKYETYINKILIGVFFPHTISRKSQKDGYGMSKFFIQLSQNISNIAL